MHWSLARQFLAASLVILLASGAVLGWWVGQQIEDSTLHNTASTTSLYINSVVSPSLQGLAFDPKLTDGDLLALDRLLAGPALQNQIVSLKVWSPTGDVLYSPNRPLIGQHFPTDDGMMHAARGWVAANFTDLTEPESIYEHQHWQRLLQVYVPVRQDNGGRIIAVAEFYQTPDALEQEIVRARSRSWLIVAALTLAMYLLLAGIVKRGSDTIARQQRALRQQVAELSRLLAQNRRLHDRVHHAAGRTTTLNEQSLRRISADLHDGPGQALALAMLRLGGSNDTPAATLACDDVAVVHGAVRDALLEIRALSAGLRLPELECLSIRDLTGRIVRDHERRSGTTVALAVGDVPETAPDAVKIALYRSLQEALSNATRHGCGIGVEACVWAEAGVLHLAVSDRGPGVARVPVFDTQDADDCHLGLVGMRERAQMLGGDFDFVSAPGHGTTVRVWWPLDESAFGDEGTKDGGG